ncbi:MAG: AraC family transcriptional regulator [Bacteroidales bacterium]
MLKKILNISLCLLLGIITINTNGFSQNNQQTKDSLLQIIPSLKDTAKLEAMRQLTYMSGENKDTAAKYIGILFDEAQKQNSLFYRSFAMAKRVEFYYSQFNSDSIFIFAQQFEKFCEDHQFFEHYFIVENILIQRYCDQEQFTLALNKAQKVYEKANATGNWLAISRSLMNLGIAYSEIGNPDEAIRVVSEATAILKKQITKGEKDVAIRLMEAYLNLVTYYENKKDYQMMSLYSDTLQRFIQQAQIERPNYDLSLYRYYVEVFEVVANSKMNNQVEAQLHLQKAKQMIIPAWGDNIKLLLWQVSSIYYEKNEDFSKALVYSDSALQFAIRNNLGLSIKANLLQNAVLLGKIGKFQQSAQTYARLKEVTDSLNNARYASQISELKTIYELDEAELETINAKNRLQITRYTLVGAVFFSLLLVIIILIIWRNRNQLRAKNLSLYQKIKEQDRLQFEHELQKRQQNTIATPSDELFERLEKFIRDEKIFTNSELSRKSLAEKLNTNETYLFEAIRDHLGVSFSEYITHLRLNYARELLSMAENNLTIEAIAIDSGFGSRNTFHRLFRERFGLTPVEFRRLATKN